MDRRSCCETDWAKFTELKINRNGPDFLFELKYDGFRSLAVIEGREELFEHVRHSESVAGWHSCANACEAGNDWANPR